MLERETIVPRSAVDHARPRWADTLDGLRLSAKYWWQTVWTAFMGMLIGIVPGAGATIASFVAYQQSRMFSKTPRALRDRLRAGRPRARIGQQRRHLGHPRAADGDRRAGRRTSAVMMVVLQYQGIVLGPRLFIDTPELAYGVFFYMTMSYAVMLLTILPLARYMSKVVFMPTRIIVPLIMIAHHHRRLRQPRLPVRHGPGAGVRRDRLHRREDELPRHRHPHRRPARTAVRAVSPALAPARAGRPDDPVLLDHRQRALGDGGALAASCPGCARARRSARLEKAGHALPSGGRENVG